MCKTFDVWKVARLFGVGIVVALLGACSSFSVLPARVVKTSTDRAFAWVDTGPGESALFELDPATLATKRELDRGKFLSRIGPLETPAGITWARQEKGEEWRVSEFGVKSSAPAGSLLSGEGMLRSSTRGSALAATWHMERVIAGHSPGNAADLAAVRRFARKNLWPK